MKNKKNIIEWIPVEDGLPPIHVKGDRVRYYIIKFKGWYPNFGNGILLEGGWHQDFATKYADSVTVTHWANVD